jgi:hypothetical protein
MSEETFDKAFVYRQIAAASTYNFTEGLHQAAYLVGEEIRQCPDMECESCQRLQKARRAIVALIEKRIPKPTQPIHAPSDYQRGAFAMKHEIIIWLMGLYNFTGADVYKAAAQKIYRMELPEVGNESRFEGFESDWTATDAAGGNDGGGPP